MPAFICIFCSLIAGVLYELAGEPGGFPAILTLVATYLVPASIALWARADAARRGSNVPYDFDSLFFFTWPVAAPVYLLRTRGLSGCGPIVIFILLFLIVLLLETLLAPEQFFVRP
jgi:hypothetical protein